ncbi:MAG: T9SS type A sorting domain-containing protein [Muribaculaceae bacterium]|nr:T9SS type A sorting domain-containing protein [Muribaculaceae bacterium]
MKYRIVSGWGIFLLIGMFGGSPAFGANEVPCIVLSGNAQENRNIDLSKYNRISFGEESMTISSSSDPTAEEVELLYSLYNHFQVQDAAPTDGAAIEELTADSDVKLLFNQANRSLSLEGNNDTVHTIGIFNLNGELLITYRLRGNESCSLQSLNSGVYIAISTDGKSKLSLKFIIP